MKIAAIINGSSSNIEAVVKSLANHKEIVTMVTASAVDMIDYARTTRVEKYDTVLIAGGDGSINNVINEWLLSGDEKLPSIAILPFGSANDYSKTIGYRNLESIIENAKSNLYIPVDTIELNAYGDVSYCINICNVGIGAEIARTVTKRRNKLPSTLNYFSATLSWLVKFKAPKLKIMVDDYLLTTYSTIVSVGKGKYAGDGLGVCPQASIDDHKMACTIIGKVNALDFINYYPKLKNAKEIDDPRLIYTSGSEIKIFVEQGCVSFETDGEFIKTLTQGQHASLKVKHAAINVIRPF